MKNLFLLIIIVVLCIEKSWASSPKKIISGKRTSIQSMPYIVSIGTPYFGTCGGTIISRFLILTAAHCVVINPNVFESRIRVLSGTSDILDTRTGEIHEVVMIYYLEKFMQASIWSFDIAILELEYPINFDETRQPIPLPTKNEIPIGHKVLTGGWGVLDHMGGGEPSRFLHKIKMNVITSAECVNKYPGEIDSSLFCAEKRGGGGIGNGDSGGPVVYNGILIGIIDSGDDINDGQALSIFSNVYTYIDWINNIIQQTQTIDGKEG